MIGRRALFGLVGVSPAPIVKRDPLSNPEGVPAGDAGCEPGALAAEKLKDGTPVAILAGGVGPPVAEPPPKTKGCEVVAAFAVPKANAGGLAVAGVLDEPKLKVGVVELPEAPVACAPKAKVGAVPFVVFCPKTEVGCALEATGGVLAPNALPEACMLGAVVKTLLLAGLNPPNENAAVGAADAAGVAEPEPKVKPEDDVGLSAAWTSGFVAPKDNAGVAGFNASDLPKTNGWAGAPTENGEADLDFVSP